VSVSDFTHRSCQPELMDGEDLSAETFAALLADLARVNTITRARPPTLAFVDRALRGVARDQPITIVDVGFGDGDMLRALARRLRDRPAVRLIGYDINPRSAPAARARTGSDLPITYVSGDVFTMDRTQPVDLVISSLVAHHMTDVEIARFLRWMDERATLGWFINDLHRHPIAYHGFRLLASVGRFHPIVRHDGAVSVKRGFTRSDWKVLVAAANLDPSSTRLRWHFPFRWGLERRR
jgi:2-polyprenyl-3-methyl-5-hydroxy-6-metoxy-1,4-benzoquinol methylase